MTFYVRNDHLVFTEQIYGVGSPLGLIQLFVECGFPQCGIHILYKVVFLCFFLDNLYQGIHEYLLDDVLEGIRYILTLEGPVQLVGPFYQGGLGVIRHIGGSLHKGVHLFLDLTLKGIEK